MRHYELMFIQRGELDDTAVEANVTRFSDLIKQLGGTVSNVDHWGKREFAYEIDHKTHGFYTVVDFEIDAEGLNELDRQLRISDDIVRHKVVRPQTRTKNL